MCFFCPTFSIFSISMYLDPPIEAYMHLNHPFRCIFSSEKFGNNPKHLWIGMGIVHSEVLPIFQSYIQGMKNIKNWALIPNPWWMGKQISVNSFCQLKNCIVHERLECMKDEDSCTQLFTLKEASCLRFVQILNLRISLWSNPRLCHTIAEEA